MRLLLTRPRPENDMLARRLISLGHEVLVEPLLSIEQVTGVEFNSGAPQAIIVTSINGARALSSHQQAEQFSRTPIYAVGAATADALTQFNVTYTGSDGVAALTDVILRELKPDAGPIIYVRGVHVARDIASVLIASGYTVDQAVMYEAVQRNTFSEDTRQAFQNGFIDGVVLFSPRTAVIFSNLVDKADLLERLVDVTFYCLSQNVSDSIEFNNNQAPGQVVIAGTPTQESLISSIQTR